MHAGPLTDCLNPTRWTRMPDGSMALGTPVADLRSNVRLRGLGAAVVGSSLGAIRDFNSVKNDLTDYDKAAIANLQREVPTMSNVIIEASMRATDRAYSALGRSTPAAVRSIFANEIARRRAQGTWAPAVPGTNQPCIGCSPNSPSPSMFDDPSQMGAGDSAASALDTLPTWMKVGLGVVIAGAVGLFAYSVAK